MCVSDNFLYFLLIYGNISAYLDFPVGSDGKNPPECRRLGFDPWVGKVPPKEGMATHSSVLAWRIPWTEELSELQSMGSQRVRHN